MKKDKGKERGEGGLRKKQKWQIGESDRDKDKETRQWER